MRRVQSHNLTITQSKHKNKYIIIIHEKHIKINYKLLLACFSISFFLFHEVMSQQDIAFHDLSTGLSQSSVTSIAQDKQGYLWIGTEYGLNRFDGLAYKHFDLHRSEQNFTNANSINSLLYDEHTNTLWIGSYPIFRGQSYKRPLYG